MPRRRKLCDAILLTLFVALIGVRVFWPQPIGLPDNGDFPKVLGRLRIWPNVPAGDEKFKFFFSDYRIDPQHIWNPHIPSIELNFARIAKAANAMAYSRTNFDVRFLGAVHGLLLVAAFCLILLYLRRVPLKWAIVCGACSILVLVDLEYLEFINCPLMDSAAVFCFVLLFGATLHLELGGGGPNWKAVALFGAAASLFLATKIQHEPLIVPLLVFTGLLLYRSKSSKAAKAACYASASLMIATSIYMETVMPPDYVAESRFSLVFLKLVPLSRTPLETLKAVHRPASDMRYVHTHAWSVGSPLENARYRDRFWRDVSVKRLIAFYLAHPTITGEILLRDLQNAGRDIPISLVPVGFDMHTVRYGLMRKTDNPVPYSRPKLLNPWSDLRRLAAERAYWLVPLFYVSCFVITVRYRTSASARTMLLLSIGLLAYLIGSLADATDTSRHIVIAQMATDMAILSLLFQAPELLKFRSDSALLKTQAVEEG